VFVFSDALNATAFGAECQSKSQLKFPTPASEQGATILQKRRQTSAMRACQTNAGPAF
jgi:hypothetical protein